MQIVVAQHRLSAHGPHAAKHGQVGRAAVDQVAHSHQPVRRTEVHRGQQPAERLVTALDVADDVRGHGSGLPDVERAGQGSTRGPQEKTRLQDDSMSRSGFRAPGRRRLE